MKENKINSFDIAYRAGVSQSTVSRALRNSPLVNKETRDKIQAIARELNYKVDKNAANLRSQTTHTLALLLFEDPTSDDSLINPFFLSMLGNITRAAASHGYDLLVSFQQLDQDWHREYELSNRADGIILLGYGDYVAYGSKLQQLADSNAHFIIWGPIVAGQPGHSIGCDNLQGGMQATQCLFTKGCKKIAFIGDASDRSPEFKLRYEGYLQSHFDRRSEPEPTLYIDADNQEISGYRAANKLLAMDHAFDGIFAASDLIAIGAIQALQKHGLAVPRDVAVVGFDDIPAASYMNPSLTTVRQDTQLAGKLLVEKLIQSIEGGSVDSDLITPSLIVRESC